MDAADGFLTFASRASHISSSVHLGLCETGAVAVCGDYLDLAQFSVVSTEYLKHRLSFVLSTAALPGGRARFPDEATLPMRKPTLHSHSPPTPLAQLLLCVFGLLS